MNNVFSRYPLNRLGNMYRIALSLPPFRDLVQLEDQRNLSFPETMRYSALTWKHSVPRESTSDKPSKICFINRLAFPMLIDSCPAASFARHRQMQHIWHSLIDNSRAPFWRLKLRARQAPRLLPLPAALVGYSPHELVDCEGRLHLVLLLLLLHHVVA